MSNALLRIFQTFFEKLLEEHRAFCKSLKKHSCNASSSPSLHAFQISSLVVTNGVILLSISTDVVSFIMPLNISSIFHLSNLNSKKFEKKLKKVFFNLKWVTGEIFFGFSRARMSRLVQRCRHYSSLFPLLTLFFLFFALIHYCKMRRGMYDELIPLGNSRNRSMYSGSTHTAAAVSTCRVNRRNGNNAVICRPSAVSRIWNVSAR